MSAGRRWSKAQQAAIQTRGRDVLVSAGAGSGKTSVLVERVMRRVTDERVDLHRLLVVTFTEAAAAEMRARIAARLEQRLNEARSGGDRDTVRWLLRQIAHLEQAQISTLHAFCMQIVRRNFLALGIEPAFVVPDEDDLAVLRATVCDDLLEQALSTPDADGLSDALALFAQDQPVQWRRLVLRLDTFARSQPDPAGWLEAMGEAFQSAAGRSFAELPWTPAFLGWVCTQLAEAHAHAKAGLELAAPISELHSYAEWLENMVARLREATAAFRDPARFDDGVAALRAIASMKSPRAGKEAPGRDEVKAHREAALGAMKRVLDVVQRGRDALVSDVRRLAAPVSALCRFTLAFQEAYDAQKRRRGWLDFNDLEHYALRVLSDPGTGEAARLQEEYVEICVDEYQDTSPVQEALVEAIRRPGGNLFEVGDVKQSIYRFRMAEPKLFLDKYLGGVERRGGAVIDLQENYRSRPDVVHAVNHLFTTLFEGLGGLRYDERARMKPAAEYPAPPEPFTPADTLAGPVEVHLIERASAAESKEAHEGQDFEDARLAAPVAAGAGEDEEPGDAADDLDSLEKEALVIGLRIRELMGLEPGCRRACVWDPELQTYRPLRWRDIVVLLRSVRSQMNRVLEVFRRLGVPAYGATATGFYTAVEVRWLTSALAAIDNPRRDVALAALLRSPMMGFADEELARIRLCAPGNLFDALRQAARPGRDVSGGSVAHVDEKLRGRCRRALEQLDSWRTLARRSGAEGVLQRLIDDTGLMEYVQGMPGGPLRVANIELLLERARAFDRSSPDGVFGFVGRLQESLWHGLDAGEARILGENEDVVRVMTIHQSKGLEFPVVFVADLGKKFYRDPDERAFPVHRSLGFGPQLADPEHFRRWRTLCSIAVEAADRAEFLAEEARILYVAMTRARERLILVGSARGLDDLVRNWTRRWSDDPDEWAALIGLPASSWLHWLIPLWCRHPDGACLRARCHADGAAPAVSIDDRPVAAAARYQVTLWNTAGGRSLPGLDLDSDAAGSDRHDVASWLAEAAANVEAGADAKTVPPPSKTVMEPIWFQPAPTGHVPSKVSATDLRRLWVARIESPSLPRHAAAAARLLAEPEWQREVPTPREKGNAFHRAMHRFDFRRFDGTRASVVAELSRLRGEGWLTEEEAASVEPEAIRALLCSDVGRRLLGARRIWREQPFLLRLDVPSAPGAAEGRSRRASVVVQGVIDCLACDDDGWLILDYKTDDVNAVEAPERAKEYAAQVATYSEAVRRALQADRIAAFLYFSASHTLVPVDDIDIAQVFQTP